MPNARGGNRSHSPRPRVPARSQPPPAAGLRLPLLLGAAGLVAILGYVVLSPPTEHDSSTHTAAAPQRPAGRSAKAENEPGARPASSVLGRGWEAKGAQRKSGENVAVSRDLPAQRPVEPDSSLERVERLLQVKARDGSVTPEKANEIRQTLQRLAERGAEGRNAIEDLRLQLESGDLDALGGGAGDYEGASNAVGPGAGAEPEGVRPLLDRLAGTADPLEIATLAQELEEMAPGEYRQQVLDAARQALQRAGQDPPGERVDVTPLFEVFEAYGGDGAAKDLEQETKWWPYSLMALAGMPDGRGVPSLIAAASDPRVPVEQRPQLTFQMLAQAAAEYPDAGAALIDLARSGQIPERAWGTVASALEGMHLSFPLQIFAETGAGQGSAAEAPRIGGFESENLDVRYDLRQVSSTWSDEQIARQIDLIDQLIEATGSSHGRDALIEARGSLFGGIE